MKRSPFWRNPFTVDPDAERQQTQQRRLRSYAANGMSAEYFESRRDAMMTLYRGGATLEEIGSLYSVTRERVRQVIAGEAKRGGGVDPIKAIQVCRNVSSLANAATELGHDSPVVRKLLEQTGYWPAVNRLWKWRQSKLHGRFSDDYLLDRLRDLAGKLGHTPSMNEVNADPDTPSHTTYVHRWGNWAPACVAAGLPPSRRGAHGHKNRDPNTGFKSHCKRGHPLAAANLYVYKENSTGRMRRVCKTCQKLNQKVHDVAKRQRLIDAGQITPRHSKVSRLCAAAVVSARDAFISNSEAA